MATFYIQLENKLLQISGDLTAENISKALGYVPVSSNVTNELSQRVDNITFDSLKDNPFLQDGSGELNIVDEAGNIIAKIDADGIHSVDFIAGEHRLSDKIDKTYVDEAVKNVKVDLTGYATEEYVNNIDFYNIKDNPIVNNGDGKLLFVDENGYIGLQLEEDGLYVKDVIADGHTLSQKADKTELSNYATKDEVSDLVDMSVVTELQGKVNTLIDTDADKSVRDIAVDVLTETLVSETATEAYDTLAEMSAWIKSHPEDASAMNIAIQKNATDITNLDAAYKAADAKVLTDAQEYTDNINFYTIKDNPIVDNNDGSLTFVDESGNIGLQFSNNAILVNDVITPGHTLSSKADKSELPTKVSDLTNDSGFITINDVPVLEIPEEYVTDEELSQKGFLDGEETSEELDDVETNTYVKYVAQTLTDEQKEQVRNNIGAIGNNSNTFVSYTQQTLTEEQQKQARLNIGLSEVSSINYDLNVKAINHRGYSYEAPENTIPAFIMSKQKGFTYVEGDVSFTKDSVAVLLHDATIDRTSNGKGDITTLYYQEVLQYDFGSWFSEEYAGVKIPTFKEWMICCKNLGLHPYIELKSAGGYTQAQISQVVNEVEECGMKGKVTYISFSNTFLGYVKNADASARLGLLANPLNSSKINQAKALKTTTNEVFLDAKLSTVTDALISTLLTNDQPLEVWTVNTEEEILKMPSYVCGVTSDFIIAGKVLYENSLVYVPPVSNWKPTTSISLDKSTITIVSLDPITLIATVEPSDSIEEVVWESSNNSIATVNNGVVTPITDGSCTITVTSGKYSASCVTTVAFTKFNITSNLVGCQLDSSINNVIIGTSWSGEITPNEGYSLKNASIQITMGGADITNTAYSNGIITIEKVTGEVVINIACVVVPVYNITRNLVGCTSNKDTVSIGEGNPYNEVFTAIEDYRLNGASVTITMGGVDISSMYSDGVLNIAEVTGDIVINVAAVAIPVYNITRSLTNCVSNKDVTSIKDGESYTETLTANDGYTMRNANVVITMNGVDITSTSYFNGVLNIDSVNGDINISAEAAEIVGVEPVVDLYLTNVQNGKIVNLGTGGSTYDATISIPSSSRDSYAVSENGLLLNNHAYANVAYGFKASDTFTIIIKARITQKSSNNYQRVYRTDQDAPSLFYSKTSSAIGGKLAGVANEGFTVHNDLGSVTGTGGALNTCYLSIYNEDGFDESVMHEYMYTSNGTIMKFYVDGVLIASQNASSLKTSTKVGIGDNDTSKTYYATQIEVSEFKIYNQELTL